MRKATFFFIFIWGYIALPAQQDIMQDILFNGDKFGLFNQELINTPDLEFSPTISQGNVIYVANSRTNHDTKSKNTANFFNLFSATIIDDTLLREEKPLDATINSPYHEGPCCFTSTGDTIYFTRNNQLESGILQKIKRLSIFFSVKINGQWAQPVELLRATDEYSFCHPAISSDGTRLYFSSNLPGGEGNYDLYFINYQEGVWSQPVHLGEEVNSPENDLFPTVVSKDILSFSSNRPGGNGGLDLYITLRSGDYYEQPFLLAPPFNSPADDLGLTLLPNGKGGFFSSNRPGGKGQDDLYSFNYKNKNENRPSAVTFIFLDGETRQRIKNTQVSIRTLFQKNEIFRGRTNRDGEVSFVGEIGEKYIIQTNSQVYETLYTVEQATTAPIYLTLKSKPCFSLKGIAYDNENKRRLSGAFIYFKNLSTETLDSVQADSNGAFKFCIPPGCVGSVLGNDIGYYPVTIPVDTMRSDLLINLNFEKQKVSIVKQKVTVGSKLSLDNIYYDFNQYKIRPGEERELNELVILMSQFPDMAIRLVSHTDTRGDAAANMELSIKRAQSAKDYLVNKGIQASRIQTEGRGETQPRNRCKNGVNCTEEEHQYNRRTEVEILRM